jgi:hypothetical protein
MTGGWCPTKSAGFHEQPFRQLRGRETVELHARIVSNLSKPKTQSSAFLDESGMEIVNEPSGNWSEMKQQKRPIRIGKFASSNVRVRLPRRIRTPMATVSGTPKTAASSGLSSSCTLDPVGVNPNHADTDLDATIPIQMTGSQRAFEGRPALSGSR